MRPLVLAAVLGCVTGATDAAAQAQPPISLSDRAEVSFRPFFVVIGERFAAQETIKTIFGGSVQPMWGGGLQIAFRRNFYFDATVSRFQRTGERGFFFEGQGYRLGIPLKVTLTPIEVSAGARFAASPTVFPYVGAGLGWYSYREESEDSEDLADTFEERHRGYLAVGGVEFRVHRSVGLAVDVQYTRVPDIIGTGGVSQAAGESDLGGVAARFRVIVGR
jgi:opacity protein-like surface antigen